MRPIPQRWQTAWHIFGHVRELGLSVPPAHLLLMSSVEDLSRYRIARLNDGRYRDISIVSPEGNAVQHSHGVPNDSEGSVSALGWVVGNWDGIPVINHSGSDGRYLSTITLMPESGKGVALLSNANGFVETPQIVLMSELLQNNSMAEHRSPSAFSPAGNSLIGSSVWLHL